MSDFDENISPAAPERRLDLLVDGELSEADRRALLLELEHDPDGWRRCALAFLEAQCWKAELGQMVSPAARERAAQIVPTGPAVSRPHAVGRWQRWRQYAATTLTIAASFLIALVVGMGLTGSGTGDLSRPGANLKPSIAQTPLPNAATRPSPAAPASDLELVTLAPQSSGAYQISAQPRDALDENSLQSIPSVIPPDLQQVLEKSGYRVVQQREIVPMQTKDNRRLVVPVDKVEIHYVGRQWQ
jgi:hypothetical protein